MEEEISTLKDQLFCQEKDLKNAATIGKQLLEENQILEQQYADLCESNKLEREKFEQEKYESQRKIDVFFKKEASYEEEIEQSKQFFQKSQDEFDQMQIDMNSQIHDMKRKVTSLTEEIEASKLVEKQNLEKIRLLESSIKDFETEAQSGVKSFNESNNEDNADFENEMALLKAERIEMQSKLFEAKSTEECLRLSLQNMHVKYDKQTEEFEEIQCQITHYNSTLKRSKDKIMELQMTITHGKLKSRDLNSKGNSLFSEVEDRRVEAEKELISMKITNETLAKQVELQRQQMIRIKLQIADILNKAEGRANDEFVRKLKEELSTARAEVEYLNTEIIKISNQKTNTNDISQMKDALKDNKFYAVSNYMGEMLAKKEEEIKNLQKKSDTNALLMHAETQRVIAAQGKVHSCNRENEKLKALLMKHKTLYEELQIKYEPDKMNQKAKKGVITEVLKFASPKNPTQDRKNVLDEISSFDLRKSTNFKLEDLGKPRKTDDDSLKGYSEAGKAIIRKNNQDRLDGKAVGINFSPDEIAEIDAGIILSPPIEIHKFVGTKEKIKSKSVDFKENTCIQFEDDNLHESAHNRNGKNSNEMKRRSEVVMIKSEATESDNCKVQ